jgi:hypothetical protein
MIAILFTYEFVSAMVRQLCMKWTNLIQCCLKVFLQIEEVVMYVSRPQDLI